jgi:hypothetical protein
MSLYISKQSSKVMANVFILTKYSHLVTQKKGLSILQMFFGEKIGTKLSYFKFLKTKFANLVRI